MPKEILFPFYTPFLAFFTREFQVLFDFIQGCKAKESSITTVAALNARR